MRTSSATHAHSPIPPVNPNGLLNGRDRSAIPPARNVLSPRNREPLGSQQRMVSETTAEDNFMNDEAFNEWLAQQHDDEPASGWIAQQNDHGPQTLSATSSGPKIASRPESSAVRPRNLLTSTPFLALDDYTYNGIPIHPNVFVELQDGDFMKIMYIMKDKRSAEITIRGWIFRRTKRMNGVLDKKLNEVCWILHIDEDDTRDPNIQGLETVPLTDIVKRRRIRLTNQLFPALSFRQDSARERSDTIESDRVLVCRYKYLIFYPSAKTRTQNSWCEKGFYRLRADECDKVSGNNMKDEELRTIWRGPTTPGGSQEGWLPGEEEFLRQECVSHRGLVSNQSLQVPSGLNFPAGDPMTRGGVGRLLEEDDLIPQNFISSSARNVAVSRKSASNYDHKGTVMIDASDADDEVEILNTPSPSTHVQQRRRQKRKRPAAPDYHEVYGVSDFDTDESPEPVLDLTRSLRGTSIHAIRLKQRSPRIIRINPQIKTSSKTDIYKKRYEGSITSSFNLKSGKFKRKRMTEQTFEWSSRPSKRIDMGMQEGTMDRTFMHGVYGETMTRCSSVYHRDVSPEASDRTLGRSQSEDSVQEMCTPTKARGYISTKTGLLTPSSPPRKGSRCLSHLDPRHPATLSGMAHKSTFNINQRRCLREDNSNFVDMSRPQTFGGYRGEWPSSSVSPFTHRSGSPNYIPGPFFISRDSAHQSHLSSQAIKKPRTRPPSVVTAQTPVKRENKKSPKYKQRRYTFGDCFCGAGGMSRGAINAGLSIAWGFDFNLSACKSYELNFFGTPIYNVRADQFSGSKKDFKVDICHLSPPCQFFSPAHTCQGKNDETNTATLFAVTNLLEQTKPRVVTLEQTFGLIQHHPIFFNAVVSMFTSHGFSVRWKILNCADFGLPQRRRRLFIIASCPGETLPPFPKPTHSQHPSATGLKPWTTINNTLLNVPYPWPNHDIKTTTQRFLPPLDGDKIATCITTNGHGNIHPSGKRSLTHREFACLQGFPLGHKFGKTGVMMQIGNAVPPVVGTVLLEEVKKALLKADGLV